ncbi:hypothetical protein [Bradyrhizobium sp. SZCCHNR1093]|uniref:IS1/IS1595 family N-terminal zinc-binding domain-containing protein n=1 Tax=Bradyrhizobium sp. SZCCHNR1093 TaxID=3057368 RepID=UPI0039656479
MRCRKCRSQKTTKNGVVRGTQRYRCCSCGFNFTQEHPKGWPELSKLLIVVSYCLGESISDLAEQAGATTASVFRWIEEAREATMGEKMAGWVREALIEMVSFKLKVERQRPTEDEVYELLIEHLVWLTELFAQKRSADARFEPNYAALGWADANRNPTDAEFSNLITKRIREIEGNLREVD